VTTSSCSSIGGVTITGACPTDPDNVKCCSKTSCGSGGNCRWNSDCAGTRASNLCPGPGSFQCCSSSAQGFGGYSSPTIPAVGACKQKAVNGAKAIVAAFPGWIREIGCIRNCACPGDSDHCCGLATDMMCSDAGGVSDSPSGVTKRDPRLLTLGQSATLSGREIAEWVMNHRSSLDLKYVIWGQRIWNPSRDAVGPWTGWRGMEDRGDITANHW
jgi:hypothetical protein